VTFRVASAGTYRVALDSAMWIDVVAGTAAIASTTHGHGPACSGVRKMVDFALRPGRYVIQLSGSAKPQAVVMVARVG
ncbi:MAG TPA: homogentisate 1,2-dioxygenase, partial [Sphingomonas sp.]